VSPHGHGLLVVDASIGQASFDLLEKPDAGSVIFQDSLHRDPIGVARSGFA
jgi:hypothetical protein